MVLWYTILQVQIYSNQSLIIMMIIRWKDLKEVEEELFWKLSATLGKNRNSRRRFDDVITSTDESLRRSWTFRLQNYTPPSPLDIFSLDIPRYGCKWE